MNDEENPFINMRSPYVLFNIGYYLMRKKEYDEKCKTKMKKYEIAELSDGERVVWDTETNEHFNFESIVDCLNEQQDTIEKQKRIIKSQDAEISRQYNLCLAMSGILREEFGVYDVFDRTKDKNIKKEG